MAEMIDLLFAFAGLAIGSWLVVGMARRLALRCNLLDIPNARSSHDQPMPLGGGLAIACINIAACLFLAFIHPTITPRHALIFIAGALLVATVSMLDDLGHVRCRIRLGIHGVAAIIFIAGYAYWQALMLPVVGMVTLGMFGVVLTFLWIVGLTNAYNFIDGVDGLAAGQAVAAGLGWTALGWFTGHPALEIIGLLLAASSLGFLIHNWHPATIFMGDVGSTFLGFSFAVLPIVASRSDPRLALAGVLLVWPAIFDSAFTVLCRLRRRQNIFVGHREFLFHRLVAAGWSHSQAALLYMTLPVLGAVLAFTWDQGTRPLHIGVVIVLSAACACLWLLVRHQETKVSVQDVIAQAPLEGKQLALAEAGTYNGSGNGHSVFTSDNGEQALPQNHQILRFRIRREPGGWDGGERRSGSNRRSRLDRRQVARGGSDRRTRSGRRAADTARVETISGGIIRAGV
jgi:UDP-N-acetylmuramyl pentapeptide phosphotransferase/UDP-N-acetylglucosamine-1-phosphate transferase